jgi:hypothetical protein
MQYTLEEIFNQACDDSRSAKLIENGYQSISLHDVKIIKDDYTHQIDLLNTSKNYYIPISESANEVFQKYGWRCGCLDVTLSNLRLKLDRIEKDIRDEVNGKNTYKLIKQLKSKRDSFMTQYTQLNNKLNDNKQRTDNI